MAWPDVLRWLALIVGGAASLMGLVWTLRCIFRPWRREAAREAADALVPGDAHPSRPSTECSNPRFLVQGD